MVGLNLRGPVKDSSPSPSGLGFGTLPVFLASISTILGAILFLRFGYAVAHVGLAGTMGIIVLGHLVTIPTALAVSEIATNRRVAGGGAYYIISRSFGTSIGGAIGISLYLSQAISVAFYLAAFAEAFAPVYEWVFARYDFLPNARWVSIPSTFLLIGLVLFKGANLGVRALRVVAAILGLSIAAFLFGQGPEEIRPDGVHLTDIVANADDFGIVFAVCFPAFTGMIAGLGLSGDLKNPQRSIPLGTIAATLAGMLIYGIVAVKLAASATPEAMAADQLIMAQIALWGPAIFIGLGAAALSSALGSILVAPRTLQALARDRVLPFPGLNRLFEKGVGEGQEPVSAAAASGALAIVFVVMGDIDFIAQVLSMFFMVTYGALCTVAFLEYFAGNPSYRPTFRSRWYISLLGAVMCGLIMVRMNALYAFVGVAVMGALYYWLRRTHTDERGLQAIFRGTMFQLTRRMQITLQKNRALSADEGWRPAIIALTRFGEHRVAHFDLLRWISHRHGFGQFVQFVEGDFSPDSNREARRRVGRLIDQTAVSRAGVFVGALVSPDYRTALTQVLQMPGISGLPNNCLLLEFDGRNREEVPEVVEGAELAAEAGFNVLVLRSSPVRFGFRSSIHLWITERKLENAPLMILLSYILVGHPEWKRAEIQVFLSFASSRTEQESSRLSHLMAQWRLPIASHNVTSVVCATPEDMEREVERRSSEAGLVISGLSETDFGTRRLGAAVQRFPNLNDVLFTSAGEPILID